MVDDLLYYLWHDADVPRQILDRHARDWRGAMMSDVTDGNSLCSCGSGLEFRRCHGSLVDPIKSPGNLPLNATEFRAGLAGFPGQLQQMHVVNQFPDDDPRSSIPSQGAAGVYEVVFVLKRPGFPLVGERQISFSSGLRGDSHLGICPPAFTPPGGKDVDRILLRSVGDEGQFEFIGTANQNGFLGKFTSRPIQARDRFHAEEIAFRALVLLAQRVQSAVGHPIRDRTNRDERSFHRKLPCNYHGSVFRCTADRRTDITNGARFPRSPCVVIPL